MNSREKGNKFEKQVQDILERNGYMVHRARYSGFKTKNGYFSRNNDVFGVFDLIAKRKDYTTKWIQVTTQSNASNRIKKVKALGNIWNEKDSVEIWCIKKNKEIEVKKVNFTEDKS